jgi:hypothetical protein
MRGTTVASAAEKTGPNPITDALGAGTARWETLELTYRMLSSCTEWLSVFVAKFSRGRNSGKHRKNTIGTLMPSPVPKRMLVGRAVTILARVSA